MAQKVYVYMQSSEEFLGGVGEKPGKTCSSNKRTPLANTSMSDTSRVSFFPKALSMWETEQQQKKATIPGHVCNIPFLPDRATPSPIAFARPHNSVALDTELQAEVLIHFCFPFFLYSELLLGRKVWSTLF